MKMNPKRRKDIYSVLHDLEMFRDRIKALNKEELDSFERMPEKLKDSIRGQASVCASSAFENVLASCNDIEASLNEACGWNEAQS